MRALRKDQASLYYYGDTLGEMLLVARSFQNVGPFNHIEAASSRTLQQCSFSLNSGHNVCYARKFIILQMSI